MTNTAICIASGPSLNIEDVEYCKGKGKIYAVKECYLMAPWADVLYAADSDWWKLMDGVPDFKNEKWTLCKKSAHKYDLKHVEYDAGIVWSNTPGLIATGGNSGFQAINLAVMQGADEIILLGYDYGFDPLKENKHWFDQKYPRDSRESNYKKWNQRLLEAAPLIPVPVINCSRKSKITCFPRADIREVLK